MGGRSTGTLRKEAKLWQESAFGAILEKAKPMDLEIGKKLYLRDGVIMQREDNKRYVLAFDRETWTGPLDKNDIDWPDLPGMEIEMTDDDTYVMRGGPSLPTGLTFKFEPDEIRVFAPSAIMIIWHKIIFREKEEALEAMKLTTSSLAQVSPVLRDDEEIVMEVIKKDAWDIQYASERLRKNPEIALEAVKKDGMTLRLIPHFNNDKTIVLAAVKATSRAYEFASDALKEDPDVKTAAGL